MTIKFGSQKDVLEVLPISVRQLHRLKSEGKLREGVHYQRQGGRTFYALELISHWAATRATPELHEQAIERYLQAVDDLIPV